MSLYHMQRPEEGVRSSGPGVTEGCEQACVCWELNPGPLQGQPVLLRAEASLQLLQLNFFKKWAKDLSKPFTKNYF